ncbi:NAD(P)-binding oxidoreductase [Nocardia sp. NPDC051787]|uniref:NAD(P)-dependent oxidoreductase n=1 Tax=Nocardia sp. NPDC051787 TaxID=3155415 RepID=UPI003446B9F1
MTNLLVLGGSGRTGTHDLEDAAARGHRVRALVRNPDVVQAPPTVELIQGTPANIDDLGKAAQGTEAVISVLNNSRASDNPWAEPISPSMFMTDAAGNTLAVMDEQGTRSLDHLIRAFGTDWTLARAVALSDKPAVGPLRASQTGNAEPAPRVSRADLAGFAPSHLTSRSIA